MEHGVRWCLGWEGRFSFLFLIFLAYKLASVLQWKIGDIRGVGAFFPFLDMGYPGTGSLD